MAAARATLCVAALLVTAWFALAVFQAHEQGRAQGLLDTFQTPTPVRTARILQLLDRAGTLNPDRSVDEMRAQALLRANRPADAVRVLQRVVRDEPADVGAWVQLGFASGRSDPALAARADARVRALAPRVPAPK